MVHPVFEVRAEGIEAIRLAVILAATVIGVLVLADQAAVKAGGQPMADRAIDDGGIRVQSQAGETAAAQRLEAARS